MTEIPLDAIGEAAFVTDADFRVVDCNARAIDLFRAPSREALLGLDAADFPNDHDLSVDGSTFVSETILHRLADGRVFVTLRDVSVRVESLHRLEEANERLRAAVRDRTEFVSNVSHELRTPLTSMSYALTNMTRGLCGPLPDKAKDYVGRLQVDVKRLLTTVNDILDLRQMENGTLTLRKSCVPLTKLFGEVVDSLSIQAQTKRQTLTLAPAPKEIYAEADRHKIERVCFNILSNAIKYTPEGGAIAVSVTEQDGQALLRVDDNGIGIPPEALPRVSQRYFRVGDQVTGTGLGLSIVREIVTLHGGNLHIESPVPGTDCGTRVTATLPTCPGPLQVIVSGDDDLIEEVTQAAEAVGLSVRVDREAIDVPKGCEGVTPARFLLDGSLPESYLGDLVCQIRGDARLAPTPILILSPGMEPSRRAEYGRMRVEVRPWPLAPDALRAILRD